jgi:hypothetical protein
VEILHRISINSKKDAGFMNAITKMGIEYKAIELPGGSSNLVTFVIDEADHNWTNVSPLLIKPFSAVNMVETRFSEDEIKKAEWLRLVSTFEQGYPQPKSNWPIKQLSYELTCTKCAIHKQTNPMRLAKEPSLGRKSFMSLIWCGEIFCTPEVIQELEKIQAKGFEDWDVIIHKTSKASDRVRQLYVPEIASPGVIIGDEPERKICPVCGRIKYYPHVRGPMYLKKEVLLQDTDFILTNEWFGSGYVAWQEILVSNRVARLLLDMGWRGVRFKVVELV